MRVLFPALWLLLMSGAVLADTASVVVARGQLDTDVMEKLGEPTGTMRRGTRTVWFYPTFTVEFEDGRVVRSELLSEKASGEGQPAPQVPPPRRPATVTKTTGPKPAPSLSDGETPSEEASTRFYRPFVRPEYPDVQSYNNIPVVFEIAQWPPGMQKTYDLSVEIPVQTGQRRTTYDTLVYELKKYPDEMLEQTLRCIYMIRNIRGAADGKDPAGLAFYTEGIILEHTSYLHHEYAHQLNYLFPKAFPGKALTAISGGYGGDSPDQNIYYKELWKRGFTSNYAMSSVQEDFAEFCSELYLQPVNLFSAMGQNPKLQEKFNVVRTFLEMVKRRTTGDDAPMDEAYFSKFDRNRWKP